MKGISYELRNLEKDNANKQIGAGASLIGGSIATGFGIRKLYHFWLESSINKAPKQASFCGLTQSLCISCNLFYSLGERSDMIRQYVNHRALKNAI